MSQRAVHWRYSLKLALAAVTTFCLLLGWIIASVHARHRHDELIRDFQSRGFTFSFNQVEPSNPVSAASWLNLFDSGYSRQVGEVNCRGPLTEHDLQSLTYFPHLRFLGIRGATLDPQAMDLICQLPGLQHLRLSECQIAEGTLSRIHRLPELVALRVSAATLRLEDFAAISRCSRLREIDLSSSQFPSDGLAALGPLKDLRRLILAHSSVTDEDLGRLSPLASLEHLEVQGTRITDAAVVRLQQQLPRLTVLIPEDTRQLARPNAEQLRKATGFELSGAFTTDATLEWLRSAKEVRTLKLYRARITDRGLESLAQLKNLFSLDIRGTAVTDRGLESLVQLPLKTLLVGYVGEEPQPTTPGTATEECLSEHAVQESPITDMGVRTISRLQQLDFLAITSQLVGDEGLRYLAQLPNLRMLWLCAGRATGDGLEFVRSLPKLERLELREMPFTRTAAEHVARAPALKQLQFYRVTLQPGALAELGQTKTIEQLILWDSVCDEDFVSHLVAMKSLKSVSILSDTFGPGEGRKLHQARPDCKVWIRVSGRVVEADFGDSA